MFWSILQEMVTILGGAGILVGAITYLAKKLLTHWMDKSIDQHKATLQAQAAESIERLRSDLIQQALEHEVKYKRNDEEIAERLNEVYVRLFAYYEQVRKYVRILESSAEPSKPEKLESTIEANDKFWDYFLNNRLYIPRGIFCRTKAFAEELTKFTNDFTANLKLEEDGREPKEGFWTEAFTKVNEDSGQVFSELVDDFQRRLGVFDANDKLGTGKEPGKEADDAGGCG